MCHKCRNENHPLRDEPASEYDLYLIQKHREAGTAPKMPRWYQAHWRACVERGYTTIAESKAVTVQPTTLRAPVRKFPSMAETVAEYVREFCRLNSLRA